MSRVIPKKTLQELKKIRDFLEEGEWQAEYTFSMDRYLLREPRKKPCGCVHGLAEVHEMLTPGRQWSYYLYWNPKGLTVDECIFIFDGQWSAYDNSPEGAIGRIDAVIDGLRF